MNRILFGIVTDVADPDNLARVQVRLHDFSGDVTLPWLRVMQPFASADLGVVCLPVVDDHVIILQAGGGVDGMVVIGSMYTGVRLPPPFTGGTAGDPLVRGMLTPAGNEIVIDDTEGAERILIQTAEAKISVLLDQAEIMLTINAENGVAVVSASGPVTVDATEITLTGSDAVTIVADSGNNVKIEGGNVNIDGSSKVVISGGAIEIG